MVTRDHNFEIQVLSRNVVLPESMRNKMPYVPGQFNTPCTLRLQNKTDRRCIVVVIFDGLAVVGGKKGDLTSPGYILGPKTTTTITSWWILNHEIAPLTFSMLPTNIHHVFDPPTNTGEIILYFFYEQQNPVYSDKPHEQLGVVTQIAKQQGFGQETLVHRYEQQFAREPRQSNQVRIQYI